jgi:hypothetical protein
MCSLAFDGDVNMTFDIYSHPSQSRSFLFSSIWRHASVAAAATFAVYSKLLVYFTTIEIVKGNHEDGLYENFLFFLDFGVDSWLSNHGAAASSLPRFANMHGCSRANQTG